MNLPKIIALRDFNLSKEFDNELNKINKKDPVSLTKDEETFLVISKGYPILHSLLDIIEYRIDFVNEEVMK